ncbi:hypothetical protein V8G54_004154 [Vigna mungo]|uniref:Potassium transporter n=1 Tax=Vigna mungo TaxID=3915 RepID=A0AAQ3PFX8_VIGMU
MSSDASRERGASDVVQRKFQCRTLLFLAYQSFGFLFGDLSLSPLYVYQSIFSGRLKQVQNEDAIFGAFSLIFWTLSIVSLLKYSVILLSVDDNGEGGIVALYSQLCRNAKFCLLPNHQASDEELSTYLKLGSSNRSIPPSPLKRFIEKHKSTKKALLIFVLLGACMVICVGALMPAISVLSSIKGLEIGAKITNKSVLSRISCVLVIGLFVMQHRGSYKVAFVFPPIIILWLLTIFMIGIYNVIKWNPRVYGALSPHYIYKFFRLTGKGGWVNLGGVFLCVTGTEAMFGDLGYYRQIPLRVCVANKDVIFDETRMAMHPENSGSEKKILVEVEHTTNGAGTAGGTEENQTGEGQVETGRTIAENRPDEFRTDLGDDIDDTSGEGSHGKAAGVDLRNYQLVLVFKTQQEGPDWANKFKTMGRSKLQTHIRKFQASATRHLDEPMEKYENAVNLVAFYCVIYPCLILQYMGQAAFLSKNLSAVHISFYASIPDVLFWPVFVVSALAAVVSSQAVIASAFSTVQQCYAFECFPRVKAVHSRRWIPGQAYIPEINWILMIISLAVTVGLGDINRIGHAYGIAHLILVFVTTCLTSLAIILVWNRSLIIALAFALSFGSIEILFLSSYSLKILKGGWIPLLLSAVFMVVMYAWHYGSRKRYLFDTHNKVSTRTILALGPSLGIVRVPGMGLIYTGLATGIPASFTHFLTNLPAFYQVVVFVCVKTVPVAWVPREERYLIGRIGPKSYRLYRCIVRNGYKDVCNDENDFENELVMSIAEFIQLEAEGCSGKAEGSADGRMAVVRTSGKFGTRLLMSESSAFQEGNNINLPGALTVTSSKSPILKRLRAMYERESPEHIARRRIRFELQNVIYYDPRVKEELMELVEAKCTGAAYVIGHSNVKANWNSSFIKKFAIDLYSFLRKNCRAPVVGLNIPSISLIKVGMNYHV